MDLAFTKEEQAFREEVRSFFRDNVPPDTRRKLVEGRHLGQPHVEEEPAVDLAVVVDRDDVRVGQARSDLLLPAEPGEALVVDGDWTFGRDVKVVGKVKLDGERGRVESGTVLNS